MRAVVFGGGGFAREVAAFLKEHSTFTVTGFVVTKIEKTEQGGIPFIAEDVFWEKGSASYCDVAFVAIGATGIRSKIVERLKQSGVKLPTFIHPTASFSNSVSIGQASIVYPHVSATAGVSIGEGVLLNSGCTIGHDSVLGDFVNLNPGTHVAGNVRIGARAFIGIGASVLENITIGEDATIGGGAMVIDDLAAGVVAVGIPAKVIKGKA